MKKLAAIFIVAVLVPSLALAWLAIRSLRHQEMVVQTQLALLHQGHTDELAADLRLAVDDIRSYFGTVVDGLIDDHGADQLCAEFDDLVRGEWGQIVAGCVVTDQGTWVAPSETSDEPRVQEFHRDHRLFLTNRVVAEVYQAPMPVGNVIQIETVEGAMNVPVPPTPAPAPKPTPETLPDAGDSVALVEAEGGADDEPLATQGEMQEVQADPELQEQARSQSRVAVYAGKLRSLNTTQQSAELPPGGYDVGEAGQGSPFPQMPDADAEAADPFTDSGETESAAVGEGEPTDVAAADPDPTRSPVFNEQAPRKLEPFAQLGANGWQDAAQVAQRALDANPNAGNWSNFRSASGEVRDIIGDQREGALSRFLEDGLHVLLWYRHELVPSHIFWVELDLEEIRRDLSEIIRLSSQVGLGSTIRDEICVALLDADSRPVATTVAGFSTDWMKPFVASEVGEILPHWEVAAYLHNPAQVASSAQTARLTLWLLVPTLLAAIGIGCALIFRDVGREMQAARQKTDFVSNVSHELRTPLTSIRMFSDLLGGRGESGTIDREKIANYSGIISTEAARLTRLINNLLDFSRMERGEKRYERCEFDAVGLVSEVVENYRMQIESEGLELRLDVRVDDGAVVSGDRDALAQVLLNLLVNAEKYAADGGEIAVAVERESTGESLEIRVLDRGPGISRREAARIFDKFYRVDDSLSTGIQGSGLGLTLARQIARGHGGDVEYCRREDGATGSCFTLRLPLVSSNPQAS